MQIFEKYKSDKLNAWILYYVVLGIIQALWTNTSAFPPAPLRICMVIAMFLPLRKNRNLVLFAIPFAFIIRGQLSTQYQYLPDIYSYPFYIGIIILSLFVHRSTISLVNLQKVIPYLVLFFFISFMDFIFTGSFGNYSIHLFIGVLLIPFIIEETDLHILSAALFTSCFLLSVYYIIMYDKFLMTFSVTDSIERSGWRDANYFATLLDYGFLIVVIYLFKFRSSTLWLFDKRVLAIGMCFIMGAVVMMASRAGFICLSVIFFVAFLSSNVKSKYMAMVTIVSVSAIYIMFSQGLFDVLIYRFFEQGNIDTGGERTTIWSQMLSNFDCQSIINQFIGGGYMHRKVLTGGWDLHNEFLSILADYGYIGEFIFVIVILSLMKYNTSSIRDNISVVFFILAIVSLSPLQYINIVFLILWIYANKMTAPEIIENQ